MHSFIFLRSAVNRWGFAYILRLIISLDRVIFNRSKYRKENCFVSFDCLGFLVSFVYFIVCNESSLPNRCINSLWSIDETIFTWMFGKYRFGLSYQAALTSLLINTSAWSRPKHAHSHTHTHARVYDSNQMWWKKILNETEKTHARNVCLELFVWFLSWAWS